MIILHAPNVHCGGGLTLLQALLECLPEQSLLIVDARLPIADEKLLGFEVYRIKATLLHRFRAENLLQRLTKPDDTVLCFGNLPPLFKLKAKVTLFIQNRYLLDPNIALNIPLKLRLRLGFERFWLSKFHDNADRVIVQTPSMKALASKYTSLEVVVAPFLAHSDADLSEVSVGCRKKAYDFIYVASGEPHKNHRNLIDAWVVLSKQGFFPSLCLTVEPSVFLEISGYIEIKKKQYGLKIDNVGSLTSSEVLGLYCKSNTLIFPSILESFGLPLIEARNAGLKIIASELDYVRDLLNPIESFDPSSPVSISRAVCRSMSYSEKKVSVMDAEAFMQKVIET